MWRSSPPNRVPASPYESDGEDGSPSKLRRDKNGDTISDAQDFVNTINGNINNDVYYPPYTMETPSSKHNGTTRSLHHRHHHHNHKDNTTSGNYYEDESPHHRMMRQRAALSPRKLHAIEELHDKHHKGAKKGYSARHIARWTLSIGLSFYLAVLARSTHSFKERDMIPTGFSDMPNVWNSKSDCSSHTRGNGCQTIPSWYKEQWKMIEDARSIREARKRSRRDRTKLPDFSKTVPNEWHRMASTDEINKPTGGAKASGVPGKKKKKIDFASIDDLCGISAKNSSLVSPESYPSKAALNKDSRVMITGILNPVGFALALRLKKHCGVINVIGFDAIYPNTVLNRILAVDQIQILHDNRDESKLGPQQDVFVPFVGLDPRSKRPEKELLRIEKFKPTHIVHLASYSKDVYADALVDPEWKNTHSPYVSDDYDDGYFYPLRSGMVSMEQLLQKIAEIPESTQPQFLYATSRFQSDNTLDGRDELFRTIKRMDELLVNTYHNRIQHGLPSIGMRMPNSIYGPWGHAGSITHDIMARAVERHAGNVANDTAWSIDGRKNNNDNDSLELLFVDDAVDSIISAMQFKPDKPITVTVPAERRTSIKSLSSTVQSLLDGKSADQLITTNDVKTNMDAKKEQTLIIPKIEQTPLKEGLAKSIAWHMDRLSPFGSAQEADASIGTKPVETGDEFLQRHEMETCGPYDFDCHKSKNYLPCNSECNSHKNCLPSVFDDTRELIYSVSEGCDIAMYTQMLGYNVEDSELNAEYMDDSDLDDEELLICNFAFVPRESHLVSRVLGKVPSEQLTKFGVAPHPSDKSSKDLRERKLDALNGRLLYRGWILIWVKDGVRELSTSDSSLMKLSPSKFFHPTVKYGLFIEENFKISPTSDDVLFLVDQMHRKELPIRSLNKEVKIDSPHGPITKKVHMKVPGEPARRAAVLLSPLRFPDIDDPLVEKYRNGDHKLTLLHASKFMNYEGGGEIGAVEPRLLRAQREFYERISHFVNKYYDLRSQAEPRYLFAMKHWVRSRWVLHDFSLEEARLLRCDWYEEHLHWNNDLDQLSFAKVMGIREVKRRIAHNEPDDRVLSFIEEHPELHDYIDTYEWHPMETEGNKLYREPTSWDSQDFTSTVTIGANGEQEEGITEEDPSLYVRIMSERVMEISRRIWTKMRKKLATAKIERQKQN